MNTRTDLGRLCGMFLTGSALLLAAVAIHDQAADAQEPSLRYVLTDHHKYSSQAVVVGDQPLLHTRQILASADPGQPISGDAREQTAAVLDRLNAVLKGEHSSLAQVVKLNFYVASDAVSPIVHNQLTERFATGHLPAVSVVVTQLPAEGALIAADAVAVQDASSSIKPGASAAGVRHQSQVSILPAGSRIYVSGQAERSESPVEATTKTLQSLKNTLEWMGRSAADVVQLKVFMMPMSQSAEVTRAVEEFFAGATAPPTILVEWKSSANTPIEIELIAWGGPAASERPVTEYLTPPGMTASPVYCRVCRINQGATIYIAGLYAEPASDSARVDTPQYGEQEVRDVFDQLQNILKETGSDLRHLVKATYYVASGAASSKLNELRPQYYDPMRPPAASKAMVTAVGREKTGMTIDMIAAPSATE